MEGNKGRLNLFIVIVETVALLFIAGSITMYYLFILPKTDRERLSFERMRWEQEQKEKSAKEEAKKEQELQLQECLKKVDREFETKKKYTCTNILKMKADCEPLGSGSYGTALYEGWNKQREACEKTYPSS